MVTWKTLSSKEAAENWDRWLRDFKDHHIRQSWAWSRHKSGSWRPLFTAYLNGPTPMAMAMALVRLAPLDLATMVWINGGPVFHKQTPAEQDLPALAKYLEGLKAHLSHLPRPVLRINLSAPMDVGVQLVLRQAGFERPLMPLDTGLTYVVDLERSLPELRDNLEKNWRNQLGTAEKAFPEFSIGRDRRLLERYLPLHNELCTRKNLPAQKLTLAELVAMAQTLGEHIVFIVVSAQGQDGCGGAVWTFGDKAYFALSAANEIGLKLHLPNAFYWRAISYLKEQGLRQFDLTGIDPKGNWGVFNFKRGLRARPVESLGEWEWSPSPWLRRTFNLALWAGRDRLA